MSNQIKIDLKAVWDGSGVDEAKASIEGVGKSAEKVAKSTSTASAPVRNLGQELNTVGEQGELAMNATAVATNAMQGNVEGAAGAVLQLANGLKVLSAVKLGLLSILIMSLVALVKAFKGRVDAARKALNELDSMRMEMAQKNAEHLAQKYERLADAIERAVGHQKTMLDLSSRAMDAGGAIAEKDIRADADRRIAKATSLDEVARIEKDRDDRLASLQRGIDREKAKNAQASAQADLDAARAKEQASRDVLAMRKEREADALRKAQEQDRAISEGKYGRSGEAYDKALETKAKLWDDVRETAIATADATKGLEESQRRVVEATEALSIAEKEVASTVSEADARQAQSAEQRKQTLAKEAEQKKAMAEADKQAAEERKREDEEWEARHQRAIDLMKQADAREDAQKHIERQARIAELKESIAKDDADPMGWREFSSGEYQRRKRREEKAREKAERPQKKLMAKFDDIDKRIKDKDYISPREREWHDAMKKRIDKRNELAKLEEQNRKKAEADRKKAWDDIAAIRKEIDDTLHVGA